MQPHYWTKVSATTTRIIRSTTIILTCLIGILPSTLEARWKAEYTSQPQEVQDWYRNAELTPEAQKRFHFAKCCAHSDVVNTKFRVSKVDGHDEWYYERAPGDWQRVPDDIIHWGESAPGGQPTLFVFGERPTCFFPGQGGI